MYIEKRKPIEIIKRYKVDKIKFEEKILSYFNKRNKEKTFSYAVPTFIYEIYLEDDEEFSCGFAIDINYKDSSFLFSKEEINCNMSIYYIYQKELFCIDYKTKDNSVIEKNTLKKDYNRIYSSYKLQDILDKFFPLD